MYKSWMRENLVDKLDLEGIINNNPDSFDDAAQVKEELNSTIKVVNNSLCYSRFVVKHIKDIKSNSSVIDECGYKLLSIASDWTDNSSLPEDLNKEIDAYFNAFDRKSSGDNNLNVVCLGITMPEEPFTKVLDYVSSMKKSLSKGTNEKYRDMENNVISGVKVAKDVANSLKGLIKYNIRDEYPDFAFDGIGAFEKIFSIKPDWEQKDIEDIEDALLDIKDQLECVEQIINSSY